MARRLTIRGSGHRPSARERRRKNRREDRQDYRDLLEHM